MFSHHGLGCGFGEKTTEVQCYCKLSYRGSVPSTQLILTLLFSRVMSIGCLHWTSALPPGSTPHVLFGGVTSAAYTSGTLKGTSMVMWVLPNGDPSLAPMLFIQSWSVWIPAYIYFGTLSICPLCQESKHLGGQQHFREAEFSTYYCTYHD